MSRRALKLPTAKNLALLRGKQRCWSMYPIIHHLPRQTLFWMELYCYTFYVHYMICAMCLHTVGYRYDTISTWFCRVTKLFQVQNNIKASFTRRFMYAIPVTEWRVRFWSSIKRNGSVHTAIRARFRMRFSICESPELRPPSDFPDKIRFQLLRRGRGIASLTRRDTVAAFFSL
jgi:hypothetical protein